MFRTRDDGTEVGTCDSCGTHYDTAQNEPRDQGAGWPRCGLCWAARRKAEEALGAMPARMAGLAVLQIVQVVVCVRAGWFRDARMFHEDAQLFFARAFDAGGRKEGAL